MNAGQSGDVPPSRHANLPESQPLPNDSSLSGSDPFLECLHERAGIRSFRHNTVMLRTPGLLYVLLLAGLTACGQPAHDHPATDVLSFMHDTEQKLLDALEQDETLPGASLHIIAPGLSLDWGAGVGYADADERVPFTARHPIRISSVTKPFVAAAILRLQEQGRIELDAPIARYLTATHQEILATGDYDPEALTVRHLLTHTSGLVDTFNTKSFQDYFLAVLEGGATKTFTLEEQLAAAVEGGEPTGAPGERQLYTDTGYILLGAILERITGQDMANATRSLTGYGEFAPDNTWWEIYEEPPAGALDRASQYYGTFQGDGFGTAPFDLFGGGGMISSAEELARFFWALFHDQVFDDPATLALMQSVFHPEVHDDADGLLKRHGLQAWDLGGRTVYGHGGWWGVAVLYSPEDDVLVAGNWLQQQSSERMGELTREIMADVLRLSSERAVSR